MIIAATGDVHSPRYFGEFVQALDTMQAKPDLFLLTGDMIDRGELGEYEKIHNVFFGKVNCPIVAVFGNNEFAEIRPTLKMKYPEIKFLDDSSVMLEIAGISIGVIGTTGSLDTPTKWQKANIPNIEKIYQERVSFVDRQLQRMRVNLRIIVIHYAPTYRTLVGENPNFYGSMGSRMYENVLIARKPSLVVHGHSHNGSRMAWVDSVPVFNVSLPLNQRIVVIDTERDLKPGIAKFV